MCFYLPVAQAADIQSVIAGNVRQYRSEETEVNWITQAICYASSVYQVDPLLITAVMEAESNFRFDSISKSGAVGLMQLMPDTAESMGINPYDPLHNVIGGTIYLKNMLSKFADCGDYKVTYALAAYNAGPQAVMECGGCPPYSETINYVYEICDIYNRLLTNYYN